MSWILDIALVLVFALCVWRGHKKGLIKALTGILAFLLATAVALLLSTTVAGIVYDKKVEPPVVTAIEDVLGQGGTLAQGADKALETMPTFLQNLLEKANIASGQDIVSKLTDQEDAMSFAQQISDQVVRPPAMKLLKAVCTLLLFIVGLLAAHIVLRVLNVLAKLPLLKQLNKSLGTVAGVLSGLLWVLFFSCVLQVVAAVSPADALISQTVVEQTFLLSWVNGINPLSGSLQSILNLV